MLDPPTQRSGIATDTGSSPPRASEEARATRELFFREGVPLLVRTVANVLLAKEISIMPLKGALLQRLVYGPAVFRPVSDVDVLVPPARFDDARAALRAAGFTVEREEPGGWEVAVRPPHGLLEVDLHRRLSSTVRSKLSAQDLFNRGRRDTTLFGVEVVLPDSRDLYAHLLLHLTLNWLAGRGLHHPEDLEAVPRALSLSPAAVARHLSRVGLAPHAALVLPVVREAVDGDFTGRIVDALTMGGREHLAVAAARMLCRVAPPTALPRRAAGFVLAPSWIDAASEALTKRLVARPR